MRRGPWRIGAALCFLLVAVRPLSAQQQPPPPQAPPARAEVETDSDPTRPVFLSVRPEFYFFEGFSQQLFITRYDSAIWKQRRVLGAKSGVILRFELPVARLDTGESATAGLGDAYGQFFVVPYLSAKFAWVAGTGLVMPTATDERLGGGKWILAPVVAPVWRLPRGLFYVKFQNFVSIGGDDSRADVNFLLVTPTFIHGVGRSWWVLADSETKTNWERGARTGVKSGFQLGRRLATGVGLWVKPEIWWGANRDGIWNIKVGVVWYQRRAPRG